MYTWKKRLLAAILAGCLSIGLMTPALAVEGEGTDPTTTPEVTTSVAPTDEVDPSFSVDPTAEPTAEPTEEPAETPTTEPTETPAETPSSEPTETPAETPSSEPTETPAETPTTEPTETPAETPTTEPTESPEITDIPEETIPGGGDPGFTMPDYANMSVEELYAAVKDMSAEDRAIVYSLLTEEQIAALEEYEKGMELPTGDLEAAQALLNDLYTIGPMASDFVIRDYLLTLTEEEWALLGLVLQPEELENLRSYLSLAVIEVEEDTSEAAPFTSVGPLLLDGGTSLFETAISEQPMQRMMRTMAVMALQGENYVEPAEGLLVNKTVSEVEGNPNRFVINMTAEAKSNIVETSVPCDIVLVLDVSGSMGDNNKLLDLKTAVNGFLDTILLNSPDSRVAIVTYSDSASIKSGLTDISDGIDTLKGVVEGLGVGGGTYSNKGLEQAYNILNGVSTIDPMYDNSRAVVLFTDGIPGTGSWSNWFVEVAETHECAQSSIYWGQVLKAPKGNLVNVNVNDTFYGHHGLDFVTRRWIGQDYQLKNERKNMPGCGATIYTVGLGLPKNDVKINEYMYRTSSSRPDGTHVSEWGDGGYWDSRTRNIQDGYYLTTDNSSELNDIFKKIANQTGKPIEGIKIRDYISPQFNIVDAEGSILGVGDTFTQGGYTGTIYEDDNGLYIEWTGIDLKPMEPGKPETAREFNESIYVEPKSGFLGGNSVPTNIAGISGVYDAEGDCIGSFPEPKVDVQIPELKLGNGSANIYYGNAAPTFKDLVTWNGTPLSELEPWQTDYVYITETNSNTIRNTEDGTYSITVKVAPKNNDAAGVGTPAEAKTATATGTVNVFKLYLTYQDTTIDLNVTPDYEIENLVDEVWKNSTGVESTTVTMMGTAPNLMIEYTPAEAALKTDQNVSVAVKKDGVDYTGVVFVWQENPASSECADCNDPNPGFQFRVHVLIPEFTFTLTKELTEPADGDQSFIFKITKDGESEPYMVVALVVKDKEMSASKKITLPSGTYTIEEDNDWSWQYEENTQKVTVKEATTVTFKNTKDSNTHWLGGSHSVENEFKSVKSGSNTLSLNELNPAAQATYPRNSSESTSGNDDEKNKDQNTEPDPSEPMETQEGGVSNV